MQAHLPLLKYSLSHSVSTVVLNYHNIINATQGSSNNACNKHTNKQYRESLEIQESTGNSDFQVSQEAWLGTMCNLKRGDACIVFLGGNSGGDVLARPPTWVSCAPELFIFWISSWKFVGVLPEIGYISLILFFFFYWLGTVKVTCRPGPQLGHHAHLY